MFSPELLSPAGSLKNMMYSFAYGADAVYAGQPRYSLRVRNNEFNLDNLAKGIDYAHQHGKQFYIVSNIAPHNKKIDSYLRDIEPVIAMKPDALIMSDPGLIMLVREKYPQQEIHLSVQANAVNYATVQFWHKQGIKRVILSRELSLDEIEEIRLRCPDVELEVFVHGALCMAYSGRCLLSGYINKRDPNQGTCTNACRWQYKVHEAGENETGEVVQFNPKQQTVEPTLGYGEPINDVVMLEENGRPGELMPAFEDEHGTYIMNSKDLRAIKHVERLTKMGVHSLKIEGRTKSFYYCARTAQVYRQAINDAVAGREFNPDLMYQLENLAHRGYTEGFLRRHTHDEYQNYEYGHSISTQQQFCGEIKAVDNAKGLLEVEVKNKFLLHDSLELMTPKGNVVFDLPQMQNQRGELIDDAKGSGHKVFIPMTEQMQALHESDNLNFGILLRKLKAGQDTRAPFAKVGG